MIIYLKGLKPWFLQKKTMFLALANSSTWSASKWYYFRNFFLTVGVFVQEEWMYYYYIFAIVLQFQFQLHFLAMFVASTLRVVLYI